MGRHVYSRKEKLNTIFFFFFFFPPRSEKVLNLPHNPDWFSWLHFSLVHPPQDYDATLPFIHVETQ